MQVINKNTKDIFVGGSKRHGSTKKSKPNKSSQKKLDQFILRFDNSNGKKDKGKGKEKEK